MKANLSTPLAVVALLELAQLGVLVPFTAACGKTEEPASAESTSSPIVLPPPPGNPSSTAAPVPSVPKQSGPTASTVHPLLLDPSNAKETAPNAFKARFTTTKGDFVIAVHREWSPNGADRFFNLVKLGFYDDTRFFRAIDGFMVQFGISGDPAVSKQWQEHGIPDDPVGHSNTKGTVTFAQKGTPGSRTTQIFINTVDNARLDASRFAPFGEVVQGMDVVEALYKGYGEGGPMGAGPDQGHVQAEGNAYLDLKFPKLDGVKHAEILK
jgi:peptidyl-prolyl cis-trans isomerase A (cyclophilin A)